MSHPCAVESHASLLLLSGSQELQGLCKKSKSHPRQWVDASDPLYSNGTTVNSLNPSNGSLWMVQILCPTVPYSPNYVQLGISSVKVILQQRGSEPSTNSPWWDLRLRTRDSL